MTLSCNQLQSLNTLLAITTGSDPYYLTQVHNALQFGGSSRICTEHLTETVQALLRIHLQDNAHPIAFHHLELSLDEAPGPLFVRDYVDSTLKALGNASEALVIITGLSQWPTAHRYQRARNIHYASMLHTLRETFTLLAPPRLQLHIICI